MGTARIATTTSLASSANPAVGGQVVIFTATVSGGTAAVPTGAVTFFDGATPLGTGTLDGTGHATLVTTALALGSHAIVATYAGDPDFAASTSPALTQTVLFADVSPSHPFFAWINALATAGLTTGCGGVPPQYCPEAEVTRAEIAVFLVKGVHGLGFQPPPATGVFADVPADDLFARWIEQILRDGITGGCATSPLRYCPGDSVTRGQMAVLVLRAKHGAGYGPPEATGMWPTSRSGIRSSGGSSSWRAKASPAAAGPIPRAIARTIR